jgi:RHS repeat-associated protein
MRPFARTAFAIAFVSSVAITALAQQERAGHVMGNVDEFSGAYTQRIPIDVPEYRGLEPNLALQYHSAAGNGWVGVGWSLTGVDYVERAHYATFDQPTLGGDRLIPCATGSLSPSCTSAIAAFGSSNGFYSTHLESFRRIQFDAVGERWIVWGTDGTRSVYGGDNFHLFKLDTTAAAPVFRWLLASRTDVHNNVVEYDWECPVNAAGGHADCFPSQIRYGNAVIEFEEQPRHDIVAFGKSSVGTVDEAIFGRMTTRLRRIWVRANDGSIFRLARVYDLKYDETAMSPTPGSGSATVRSVLISVKEYGKDATIVGDEISGSASSFPALTFDYSGRQPTSLVPEWGSGPQLPMDCQSQVQPFIADFDGNRCDDYLWATGADDILVWFSNCNGTFTYSQVLNLGYPTINPARRRMGDFNGDGRTDLLLISSFNNTQPLRLFLADRNPSTGALILTYQAGPNFLVTSTTIAHEEVDLGRLETGDFNADGLTDIAIASGCHHPTTLTACNVATPIRILLTQKSGATLTWTEVPGPPLTVGPDTAVGDMLYDVRRPKYADFNGDGRTDISVTQGHDTNWGNAQPTDIHYARIGVPGAPNNFDPFTGTGPRLAYRRGTYITGGGIDDDTRIRFGDFNGDGFSDLVYIEGSSGGFGPAKIWLSSGSGGRFGSEITGPQIYLFGAWTPFSPGMAPLADFNGDGRTDVGRLATGGALEIRPSIGYDATTVSFSQAIAAFGNHYPDCSQVGDFDGDGRADVGDTRVGGLARLHRANATAPDLLTQSSNGIGGVLSIAYTPSSAFKNDPSAPVKQVVTSMTVQDGAGGSATTDTTYAGAKYDAPSRRFLGFATVTDALPLTPSDTVRTHKKTTFVQDPRTMANLEDVLEIYKGVPGSGGFVMKSTDNDYRIGAPYGAPCSGNPPYVTLATRVETRTMDESGTGCGPSWPVGTTCAHGNRTVVEREYDIMAAGTCGVTQLPAWQTGYGNVTREKLHGDYDLADDAERSVDTLFPTLPNFAGYVVDKPVSRRVRQGTSGTGAILQQENYFYDARCPTPNELPPGDGSTGWDVAVAKGDLTATARWINVPTPRYVFARAEYDCQGNRTATIDELGNRDRTVFDATYHLFPTLHENAMLHQRVPAYDFVCGVLASERDPNLNMTTHTLDNLCRRTRTDFPGGGFETVAYSLGTTAATRYTRKAGPGANANPGDLYAYTYFDGLGRTTKTMARGPDPTMDIVTTTAYDLRGRIASAVAQHYANATPPAPTTMRYDPLDREVRVTLPDTKFRTFEHAYESGRYRVLLVDEESKEKKTLYDGFGEVCELRQKKTNNAWISARFVHRLDRTETIDPLSNSWIKLLDSLGRVYEERHPDKGTWNYEYWDNGLLKTTLDNSTPRKETYLEHDGIGRKILKGTQLGQAGENWTYWEYDWIEPGYANVGRLVSMYDIFGQELYHWDAAGNLVKKERQIGVTNYVFDYGFDTGNRLRWRTFPDGDTYGTAAAPIVYDDAGRQMSGPGVFSFAQYTAWGALSAYGNNNGVITVRTYDPARQWLTAIDATKDYPTQCSWMQIPRNRCVVDWCGDQVFCGPGTFQCCQNPPPLIVQDLDYIRDGLGRVTEVTSPVPYEGWSFTFDNLGRLTDADSATNANYDRTYTYDDAGNITSNSAIGSYVYQAPKPGGGFLPHAVSSAGGVGYTYDANGNMTGGRLGTMTWDGDGLPTAVGALRFTYDGEGRRIRRFRVGNSATVTFFPDNDYEVNLGVSTKYFRIGDVLVAKRKSGWTEWLHTDNLGSVMAITNSSGDVTWRQQYHAYGEPLAGPAGVESHGFTGERHDETGLVYLTARYYDPILGRFISADDRVGAEGIVGLNPYAYAANDPVNNTDHSGHTAAEQRERQLDPSHRTAASDSTKKPGAGAAVVEMTGNAAQAGAEGLKVVAAQGARADAAANAGASASAPRQMPSAKTSTAALLIGSPAGQKALATIVGGASKSLNAVQVLVPVAKGDLQGAAKAAVVVGVTDAFAKGGAALGMLAPPGAQFVTVPAGAFVGSIVGSQVGNAIVNAPPSTGGSPTPSYDSRAGKYP